jgi:hypothetical protein
MIKFFALAFLLFIISCNNKPEAETEEQGEITEEADTVYYTDFQTIFPELTQYMINRDSSFSPERFANGDIVELDSFTPHAVDKKFMDQYGEYLFYNADSSLALDLVSYNFIVNRKNGFQQLEFAGPDTEVGLINMKDSSRKRILFLGSSGIVLDGSWDEQGNIILAGAQDAGDDNLQPLMWKVIPGKKQMEIIQYPGVIKANVEGYFKQKYKPVVKTSPSA